MLSCGISLMSCQLINELFQDYLKVILFASFIKPIEPIEPLGQC